MDLTVLFTGGAGSRDLSDRELRQLGAEGYARPIRSDVELPAELSAKMIPDEEYTNTIPLTDNDAVTATCTEIATRWEEEIIPLMG